MGPRYVVTYSVNDTTPPREVVQSVYPFAQPHPVTYIAPDQSVFPGQRTVGGWFVAKRRFRDLLIGAGVPEPAARAQSGPTTAASPPGEGTWLVALVAVGCLIAFLFLARRNRRLGSSPG